MEKSTEVVKKPGLIASLVPIILMILLLIIGYGVYHIKAQVLLVSAAFLTAIIAVFFRIKWPVLEEGIVSNINKAMPAILIMLTVGILVGSWIVSGTIPMLIYYGLKIISPRYFLVTASFVTSIVSLATGTSWGTIGTLGVTFIGIAAALGMPMGISAGAIVAGAYFGDKMSPFSDVTNLAPVVADSNLFDHIKHMSKSAVPAWLLGLLIYFIIGLNYTSVKAESSSMLLIMETLKSNFVFSWWLLLPMVIVFYFAFAKKPVLPGMLISSFVAGILAIIFQGSSVVEVAKAMNTGFVSDTGLEMVDKLISRGGMMSMMEVQLIAFTAFAFSGIMQASGMLEVIFNKIKRFTRKVWSLVSVTISLSIFTALVTGSSYLSMIVPGELLSPIYRERKLASKNLSRIIEEAGGIIVPLIPWSMAGVYVTGTLGVSPFEYLPWAFMNYFSVIILLIYGITGITMEKAS